jgi:hypothetical protein
MKARKRQQVKQVQEQQDSPITCQTRNQTTVTQLYKKSALTNDYHDTELKAAKPDKRKG